MYGQDVVKEIVRDYSIPLDAENRLLKIVAELETEYELLRENYEFYKNIVDNLTRMVERIRHLKFKGDPGDEIHKKLLSIYDVLLEVKDSQAQKFVDEYLRKGYVSRKGD
jgi:hypothetical protein